MTLQQHAPSTTQLFPIPTDERTAVLFAAFVRDHFKPQERDLVLILGSLGAPAAPRLVTIAAPGDPHALSYLQDQAKVKRAQALEVIKCARTMERVLIERARNFTFGKGRQ